MIGTEFINIQGDPSILDRTCSVYCTDGKVDFSPDKTQLLLPSAALQVIVKAECKADLPAVAKTLTLYTNNIPSDMPNLKSLKIKDSLEKRQNNGTQE